jgi:hypothetical protein
MRWTNPDNTGQKWTGRDIGHVDAEFRKSGKMAQLGPRAKDKLARATAAGRPPSRGCAARFGQASQETA